jgi:hypothetical protein
VAFPCAVTPGPPRLSPANNCLHKRVLTSTLDTFGGGVSLDGSSVVVGGSFSGTLGQTESKGEKDIFVHRYAADLAEELWRRELGTAGDEDFAALAVSPLDGSIVVAGTCRGPDFGGAAPGAGDCDGDGDGFLVRLSP